MRGWPALAFAAVMGLPGLSPGQATGRVEGVVRDPRGAPVPGATVELVRAGLVAVTNQRGHYSFATVPIDTYTVRAQSVGYQTFEVRGALVRPRRVTTVDFRLSIAQRPPAPMRERVAGRSATVNQTVARGVRRTPRG
jgi:hypothetical protein